MSKTLPKILVPTEIAKITQRIKLRMETCLIETGKDLLAAKKLLPHGEFQSWLKANFDWSLSTATKLMNVANDPKSVNFTDLPKAAQYALSAPSTPETVKDAVIADLKAGKTLSVKQVKATIAEATKPETKGPTSKLAERMKAVGFDETLVALEQAFPKSEFEINVIKLDEDEE